MTQPEPIGLHLLADLSGIAADRLRDADAFMGVLRESLAAAGFHVLRECVQQFPAGAGFTGVALLSESHAAVHTYPERGYAAFDLFGCGSADPQAVLDAMIAYFAPAHASTRTMPRTAVQASAAVAAAHP